jgi:hypothetical protein
MISDTVLVAAITGITSIVSITIPSLLIYRNKAKIDELGTRVDGRLDQMLALAESGAFARGVKQEVDKISGVQP